MAVVSHCPVKRQALAAGSNARGQAWSRTEREACCHFFKVSPHTLYTLVFRCISGQTSPLLSDLFCLRSVSTTHRTARLTRSQVSNGLVLPNVSRRFGLHSLSYLAAVKWNSAPPDIRNATSLHDLRIQLCTWLGHPVRRPIGL